MRRIRRPFWERSDGGTKDKKTFLFLPFFPHRSLLPLLWHTVVATIVSSLSLSLLFPFRGEGGKAFYAPLLLLFPYFFETTEGMAEEEENFVSEARRRESDNYERPTEKCPFLPLLQTVLFFLLSYFHGERKRSGKSLALVP